MCLVKTVVKSLILLSFLVAVLAKPTGKTYVKIHHHHVGHYHHAPHHVHLDYRPPHYELGHYDHPHYFDYHPHHDHHAHLDYFPPYDHHDHLHLEHGPHLDHPPHGPVEIRHAHGSPIVKHELLYDHPPSWKK